MAASHSGTVTFLFTDIEGSTALWERFPDAMRDALALHDSIVRRAIEAAGGTVFDTAGDAFCAAFARPSDAVDAAVAMQRALLAADWGEISTVPVRAALYTGTAELRDANYFGPPLNRCARVLSAGHGGQVLLADATHALVAVRLPEGASLRDLGEHRLRGVPRPERIFQLVATGLPSEFPPLTTTQHDALPRQATSFVGREQEVAAIRKLLGSGVQLVTLTGPGGTGKTRLALEVARAASGEFDDGTAFVPLAAVGDAADVVPAIAAVLGIRESDERAIDEVVLTYLRGKHLLLVVDNVEHVLAAAPQIGALLDAPKLVILATSRSPLHLTGERLVPIAPLGVPDVLPPEPLQLLECDAVRLFVERANNIRPFALSGRNAGAVAELCRRLEGLPLAIELAAARTSLLSPEMILARLDHSLKLLIGGERDRDERQQTMRNAIAWSHDLLSSDEQTIFRRLAVFRGGCTLDAVETVAACDMEADPLDLVGSLVDHSLLRMDDAAAGPVAGEPRFTMLEVVREFALERLEASGELSATRDRHAALMLDLAERAAPELRSRDQLQWLERLESEHPNMMAALAHLASREDAEPALRLAVALGHFWNLRSHRTEGRSWYEELLNRAGAPHLLPLRAAALKEFGELLKAQARYPEAEPIFAESVRCFASLDDPAGLERAKTALAFNGWYQGRGGLAEIRKELERNVDALRNLGDAWGLAEALHYLGHVVWDIDGSEATQAVFEESLSLFRSTGDRWGWAQPMKDLGLIATRSGDFATARAWFAEALELLGEVGEKNQRADTLNRLGELDTREGRFDDAQAHIGQAITLLGEEGSTATLAESLNRLAWIATQRGDFDEAMRLHHECLNIGRSLGNQVLTAAALSNLSEHALRRGELADAAATAREGLQIFRELQRAVGIGACLGNFAALAAETGDPVTAVRLFGAAEATAPAGRVSFDMLEHQRSNTNTERIDALREALSSDEFAAAWVEGKAMSLDDAIDLALGLDLDGAARAVTGPAE
jgi:predicted ATPase/class 3 adenylate cyclase